MSKPAVCTEISFVPFGPHIQVEQFRNWLNNEFRRWAWREFKVRADGSARRRNGDLMVSLVVHGPSQEIIRRIAKDFSSLEFRWGSLRERSQWSFTATEAHVEYEFTDENGERWHGADGHYEKCPYEDEDEDQDEDELVEAEGAA